MSDLEQLEDDFSYPPGLLSAVQPTISPVKTTRTLESPLTRKRPTSPSLERPRKKWIPTAPVPAHLLSLASDSPADDFCATSPSSYGLYMEAVLSNCAGFYRVSDEFFVVQGWDHRREQASEHWYHLHFVETPESTLLGCSCPLLSKSECVHRQFFRDYEVQNLQYSTSLSSSDIPQIFLRQQLKDGSFSTKLSVPSTGTSKLKGRAIVSHQGATFESGIWHCSKDQGRSCLHILSALKTLIDQQNGAPEGLGIYFPSALDNLASNGQDASPKPPTDRSVSFLPIRPPHWAELPTDQHHYQRSPPCHAHVPTLLHLTSQSRCSCDAVCTFDQALPTTTKECKIYTITQTFTTSIELQPCPRSPATRRRFIGPDLRELGLFNYNNSAIFSHDLLDDYTSAFCTSETPFVAWVTVVSRRYKGLGTVFVGEDLFRSAWFAYVKLQDFTGDMICSHCGVHPDTIIWDGVTLSFGRKRLLGSLEPPTVSGLGAPVRKAIKYQSHQQLIKDSGLRKRMCQMLKGLTTKDSEEADVSCSDDDNEANTRKSSQKSAAAIAYIELVDGVRVDLNQVCSDLSDLVYFWYGPDTYSDGRAVPLEYQNFLRQIAAEESVLQMVNVPSLHQLRSFLESPNPQPHYLLSMPAIYHIYQSSHPFNALTPILIWIEGVARSTILGLVLEPPLPNPEPTRVLEDSWMKTGCLYSMPKIRERPIYPSIRGDNTREKTTKRGGKCSKYYSQYGQQSLTGGIVAAWCTHSICYGFHCLPESEGRNDVFSAMVTRWPKAPKRVIYDFACSLGPYCMLREPQFFAETSFLINHFHSTGHSKCSRACFLSEYANTDPSLAEINSSAAECGNGGMKKIRKSVSYMGQERAIIYTKVYLSIWNRTKLLRISKGV